MHSVLDRLATATHDSISYLSLAASNTDIPFPFALLLSTFVLLVLWYTIHAVYNLYFSPLSSIPGPKLAGFSDLWLIFHGALQFRQCKVIHELFEIYGPVVRIGPGKVAFKDLGAGKVVYGGSIGGARFEKSDWYKSLMTNDNDHAMTVLPHTLHAPRKKAYSGHYNPTNLSTFQPEIHHFTLLLVDILKQHAKEPIDCLLLFRQLMIDVISATSFGPGLGDQSAQGAGALESWAAGGSETSLSKAIGDFAKRGLMRSVFPRWAWALISRIPNKRWKELCDSDMILAEIVTLRLREAERQLVEGKADCSQGSTQDPEGKTTTVPLAHHLLQFHTPTTNEPMPEKHIVSELMGHLIAGSDTTSTTLSYLCWELSRKPAVANKLQAEVDSATKGFDSRSMPDISIIQNLPYLNAFVQEGLRLYSAGPSLLERIVPSTTNTRDAPPGSEGYDLLGFALPPGTIVGTQAWSLHRDPRIFTSPDDFDPDRWVSVPDLQSSPHHTDEHSTLKMHQHMMPFGSGTRICGGKNLALILLRVVIFAIVKNFEIVAPDSTTEGSMEIMDSFVIFPASGECKLVFKTR